MKKTFLTVLLFYIFTGIAVAQNLSKTTEYKILLTGASFASPQNGWFEIGCRKLNAEAINRAIGGEAIANTANRMANGTLYSKEELENIDALVIMQVHNKDVYEELQLKDKYTDYEVPFDRSNYAAAYDYVKLAAKWGFPLIEFDKYIGFSKNVLHPVTGKPFSQLYSTDIQVTEGIAYGHHPIRGEQSYMQQRMAAIFVDSMNRILPIKY